MECFAAYVELYIPHGSDESVDKYVLTEKAIALYIPHGSDESKDLMQLAVDDKAFISHMVQMKAINSHSALNFFDAFISHMVQMKALSTSSLEISCLLYIPHGSDERPPAETIEYILEALYPTWFR